MTTLDAHTESSSTAPADPYTFSHTVGSGATVLFVLFGHRATAVANSVTYGGNAMTKVRADNNGTDFVLTEIWYLVSPPTGSNTVSIDFVAAPATISAQAVSFLGTLTTASVIDAHNGTTNVNTDSTISVNLTSVGASVWMIEVIASRGTATITEGAGSTGRTNWSPDWEYEPGGNEAAIGGTYYSDVAASTTKTFDWSYVGVGAAHSCVSIANDGGGGAPTPKKLALLGVG